MTDNTSKNVTIAKNSFFLFARTFISIIVTLYTSRVFLNQLGVEDYGIYNLVGGVVALFGVLTSFMTGATQRFLSVKIGENDVNGLNKIFNISITLHLLLALVFLVFGEIIGIIMISFFLKVPEGKEFVTQVVFHISLFTSVVTLVKTPYAGLIIARERMSFYAYLSILEVVLKLIITLMLILFTQKLIAYSFLFLLTTVLVTYIHIYYCSSRINAPRYKYYHPHNNPEYKEMLGFSGWTFIGNTAAAIRDQGSTFLLNIFFGVLLNAAMGIVNQVAGVFTSLFINVQSAFRPQIIQCSVNDIRRYNRLLSLCTFYTIILMGFICAPMIVACNTILSLWLGLVPDYSVLLVQLIMFRVFFSAVSQCVGISLEAYADIKTSMIFSVILACVCLGVMWLFFFWGVNPSWAIIILTLTEFGILLYRLLYASKTGYIQLKDFVSYNWKAFFVVLLFMILAMCLSSIADGYFYSFLFMLVLTLTYCLIAYLLMESSQRELLKQRIQKFISNVN